MPCGLQQTEQQITSETGRGNIKGADAVPQRQRRRNKVPETSITHRTNSTDLRYIYIGRHRKPES